MNNVLVLGGGLQALSVVSSLKESGCCTFVMGDNNDPVKYSRCIDCYIPACLSMHDSSFLNQICNEVLMHNCRLIIPMSDKLTEFLSINRKQIELRTRAICAVMDYEILSIALNKRSLLDFCEQNSLPHPKNISLENRTLKEAVDYIGFPALIKPDVSVGARGITLVRNYEELKAKIDSVTLKYGTCCLQEYIEHKGRPYYNVMLFRSKDGEVLSSTVLEIMRYYPIKGGSSSFGRTIYSPQLVRICSKVLDLLGWIGFADFDVLQTEEGEYKIIEINPRVPASLRAAAVSGINFPEIMVDYYLNGTVKEYKYQPGKYLRFLGLDLMWFLKSPNRFKVTPSWFTFWSKDLYYQEGGIYEWRAMICFLLSGIRKVFDSEARKEKKGMN